MTVGIRAKGLCHRGVHELWILGGASVAILEHVGWLLYPCWLEVFVVEMSVVVALGIEWEIGLHHFIPVGIESCFVGKISCGYSG